MPRGVLVVLLALVALSSSATSAGAEPRVVPDASVGNGPALAGADVLWTETFGRGVFLMRGRVGGRPRRVARLYTIPSREEEESAGGVTFYSVDALAAAPATMAIWISSSFPKYSLYGDNLYAGPLGPLGPPVASASGDTFNSAACSRFDTYELDATPGAVVFSTGASSASGCPSPAREHVYVQTLPRGGDPVQVDEGEAADVNHLHIAGRFVAWAQTRVGGATETVVYDRDARAVAYRVAGDVASLDVDDAGRLALARSDGSVEWHAPGDATPHRVALDSAERVAIGGDRVAYQRAADGDVIKLGTIGLGAGDQPVDAATLPRLRESDPQWDFDGRRLAWAQPACISPDLLVENVLTRSADRGIGRCVVRFRSRTARLRRSGHVRIRLRCPRGCYGDIWLTAAKLFRGRRRGDLYVEGNDYADIRLKPGERRKLRRLGRVRARATALPTEPRPGARYSRRLTLLAR